MEGLSRSHWEELEEWAILKKQSATKDESVTIELHQHLWGWEVGVAGAGESGGRKMETTVLEQQLKKENKNKKESKILI